jgi:hypothetical protein
VSGIVAVVVVIVLLLGACVLAVFFGFRRRAPWALDALRWMTKVVFNPFEMKRAGRAGAYAGVIEHRGRVSGTTYRTRSVSVRPTTGS